MLIGAVYDLNDYSVADSYLGWRRSYCDHAESNRVDHPYF